VEVIVAKKTKPRWCFEISLFKDYKNDNDE